MGTGRYLKLQRTNYYLWKKEQFNERFPIQNFYSPEFLTPSISCRDLDSLSEQLHYLNNKEYDLDIQIILFQQFWCYFLFFKVSTKRVEHLLKKYQIISGGKYRRNRREYQNVK